MQIVSKAKKLPGMTGEKKDKKEKDQAGDGPPGSGLRFFFLWSFFVLFFLLSRPCPPSPLPPHRGDAVQAFGIGILGDLGFSHSHTRDVYIRGVGSIYMHVFILFLTRAALGLLTFTCMRCSIDVCSAADELEQRLLAVLEGAERGALQGTDDAGEQVLNLLALLGFTSTKVQILTKKSPRLV